MKKKSVSLTWLTDFFIESHLATSSLKVLKKQVMLKLKLYLLQYTQCDALNQSQIFPKTYHIDNAQQRPKQKTKEKNLQYYKT